MLDHLLVMERERAFQGRRHHAALEDSPNVHASRLLAFSLHLPQGVGDDAACPGDVECPRRVWAIFGIVAVGQRCGLVGGVLPRSLSTMLIEHKTIQRRQQEGAELA